MELTQIGTRMRKARRDAGLSQGQLAEAMNTTQSAVSLYESGQRGVGLVTADAVCRETGCTLEFLLGMTTTYYTVAKDSPAGELIAFLNQRPETAPGLWDYAHFLRWKLDEGQAVRRAG